MYQDVQDDSVCYVSAEEMNFNETRSHHVYISVRSSQRYKENSRFPVSYSITEQELCVLVKILSSAML